MKHVKLSHLKTIFNAYLLNIKFEHIFDMFQREFWSSTGSIILIKHTKLGILCFPPSN